MALNSLPRSHLMFAVLAIEGIIHEIRLDQHLGLLNGGLLAVRFIAFIVEIQRHFWKYLLFPGQKGDRNQKLREKEKLRWAWGSYIL